MSREINLDDGYSIRIHPGYGMEVFMRKSEPGVFLNAHGDEVAVQIAQEAGFNTEVLLHEKERRAKVSQAEAEINKLYAGAGAEKVVKDRNGYSLVDIGFDRFVVRDPEGRAVNTNPVSGAVAEKLFDQLVPAKVEAASASAPKQNKPGAAGGPAAAQ